MAFLISLFTAKVGKQDVFNGPICCSCRHKVTLPQFPVHPKDQISLVHCQRELAHEHTQHTNNALPHMLCTKTHKLVFCEDTFHTLFQVPLEGIIYIHSLNRSYSTNWFLQYTLTYTGS